jgi:hypothetical protein
MGAIMAALKIDKQRIIAAYGGGQGGAEGAGSDARSVASEVEPDEDLDHRGPGGAGQQAHLPGKSSGRGSGLAPGGHHARSGTIAGRVREV